ncbi:hypothetical protein [Aeromonas veronii]|uniref:hypothetical protein n=1 Tax=Aeromonas veronii TaxID=654 RepID=UPI000E09B785|nr:hypothetical protein [Aeromonas veronii]RDE61065.1 hypothetical protein DV708_17350 [Aeromonas veronii]
MIKRALSTLIVATLLGGCASDAEKMAQDQLNIERMRQDAAAEARNQLTGKLQDQLDSVVPSWYLEPPKMDGTGIYGVGTAHTKDLGFSVRKAKLLAIYEAAKVFKQEMSGQERSLQRDNGDEGDVAQRTELLVDALVARVPVSGYDIVKTEVKSWDGQFHAFVLAKIPFDEFNSVLKMNKDGLKGEFDEAFDALEMRLNEREARAAARGVMPAAAPVSPPELSTPKAQSPLQPAPQMTTQQVEAEIAKMLAGG